MTRPPEPILHLDMDAFYASVEALDEPQLAGRPLLVGGTGSRGVVASASYEARRFGVTSAMPMAQARRRCPDAVVLPPRFDRYRQVSAQVLDLLRDATPLVEPLSLDEAFLDVGGSRRLLGEPIQVATALRRRIHDELRLPASVAAAPNKHLAKLGSQLVKRVRAGAPVPPGTRLVATGVLHVPAADVDAFLVPLPVRSLWGVGERSAEQLERFGVRSVADVRACAPATLSRILGAAAAEQLRALAAGRDDRSVTPYEPAKGMSAEETFAVDVDDVDVLRRELLRLAETVAARLRAGGVAARTVTLKLRDAGFATITRSRTLSVPCDQATVLHRETTAALEALRLQRTRVRLVGVGATNLVPTEQARQLDLLADDRWSRLERAADDAAGRFGTGVVTRGALLDAPPTSGDESVPAEAWRRGPTSPDVDATPVDEPGER